MRSENLLTFEPLQKQVEVVRDASQDMLPTTQECDHVTVQNRDIIVMVRFPQLSLT